MYIYKKLERAIKKTDDEKLKEELGGLLKYVKDMDNDPDVMFDFDNRKQELTFLEEVLWTNLFDDKRQDLIDLIF